LVYARPIGPPPTVFSDWLKSDYAPGIEPASMPKTALSEVR
jgi:hypothetical protein